MKTFQNLNLLVHTILLTGLVLTVSLIMVGLVWQWISTSTFGSFPAVPSHNLLEYMLYILHNITVEGMGPAALVNGGIAILLLTPFARVFASVFYFGFWEHNRVFTTITGFVLVILGLLLFT